jgi:hypothetical protein
MDQQLGRGGAIDPMTVVLRQELHRLAPSHMYSVHALALLLVCNAKDASVPGLATADTRGLVKQCTLPW